MEKIEQGLLFEKECTWVDMPEYNNIKEPKPQIIAMFKFKNKQDFDKFNELLKNHVYNCKKVFDGMQKKDIKQAWFPLKEKGSDYIYK